MRHAIVVVVGLAFVALVALLLWASATETGRGEDWRRRLGLAEDGEPVAFGFIEARQVNVAPETGGRVAAVFVTEGDTVAAGEALLALDREQADIQLRQAEAALDGAFARLERLREGARPEQLAALEDAAAAARAGWERAQAELAALEAGAGGGLDLSPGASALALGVPSLPATAAGEAALRVDLARARSRAARATWDLANARLAQARAGPSEPQRRAAEAGVRAAEARLAAVDLAAARLTLRAPISGTVTQVLVRPGEALAPGRPAARVARLDPLTLTVYVPADTLGRLSLGQEVAVQVDGFEDRDFSGRVEAIAGEAEYSPRNVQSTAERAGRVFAVRISLPNPDGDLKPGLAAEARFGGG